VLRFSIVVLRQINLRLPIEIRRTDRRCDRRRRAKGSRVSGEEERFSSLSVAGWRMSASRVLAFTDPYPYQSAIRGAQFEVLVTGRGDFRAELTQIELPRLWMQRGRESVSRIFRGSVNADRAAIGFLTEVNQPAKFHCGRVVAPGDIVVNDAYAMHRRTEAPCRWGAMSLTPDDLAVAGRAIAGRELTAPSHAHIVRPSPSLMARLLSLHERAGRLARTAPEKLAHPQVSRALDQALVHAMVMCLTEGEPVAEGAGSHRHSAIIAKLDEILAENQGEPVYLAEICAATGATERTLRACCHEHLGMGVIRYLWLRRMHIAHRALEQATPTTATVTEIATECGFWELGRFSVEYRALFGETPSQSLRRPPGERPTCADRLFALAS
jgi:AraC-like DNA-binding protein